MKNPRPSGAHGPGQQNDPGLLILMSLASGSKHGHAIMQDIEAFASVRLGPGTLYGAIARLEERGLISPTEGDLRRRPYVITALGAEALSEALARLDALVREGASRVGITRSPRPALIGRLALWSGA